MRTLNATRESAQDNAQVRRPAWGAALKERGVERLLFLTAALNIALVAVICLYLVAAGLPALRQVGVVDFLFGARWASTDVPPEFGILPFILTSLTGTAAAVVVGLPLGLFSALYLGRIASRRVRALIEPLVDLLASIPSVVYGFLGMLLLVPAIQTIFGVPDGSGWLAAVVVLTVMVLPTIIKVSLSALDAVPEEYVQSSLALGATHIETLFRVVLPAARSGIAAAVVLGVGRAIGEAMAVMMVAGNVANMPAPFESVRFLTTAIASEMAYSSGLQRDALFSIALVLFVFIMLVNTTLNLVIKKKEERR